MHFKPNNQKDGLRIKSTQVELQNRWSILSPNQMQEKTGAPWGWFNYIMNRKKERTKLHCGYDNVVERPVIVKTIFYRSQDLQSMEAIENRRQVLREQITILNDINSPLLPEPLDWFEVRNTVDNLPEALRDSEPVLILDYLPGTALGTMFKKKKLRFKKDPDSIDTPKIGRIALKFLQFFRVLDEKGYAYLDFKPEHILFLKNDIPRFIGIGSICGTKADGSIDENHINFTRTSKGYAAPELLNSANNWQSAKEAKSAHIAAFSLGVILHQMMIEKFDLLEGTVENGSFFYPNGVSENLILNSSTKNRKGALDVHNLITDLCKKDPHERLTDFNEIEERLHTIARSVFTSFRDNEMKKKKRQQFEKERREALAREEAKRKQREKFERERREEARRQQLEKDRRQRERLEKERQMRQQAENERRQQEQRKQEPSKKPGWCFLSTAAYGTPTHANLDILREFRDTILRPVPLGRKMLAHYATVSPKISHLLRGMPLRKRIIRSLIDLTVKSVKRSLQSESPGWGIWVYMSIILYYIVFGLSYLFVLPEKSFGIQTTTNKGEDE